MKFHSFDSQKKKKKKNHYYQINTIIFVYVSRLKKFFSYFSLLLHINYFSQRQQHFALSFLFSSPRTSFSLGYLLSKAATLCSLFSIFVSTHRFLSWLSSFSKWLPLGSSLFSLVRLPFFFLSVSSTCGTLFLLTLYSPHKTTFKP